MNENIKHSYYNQNLLKSKKSKTGSQKKHKIGCVFRFFIYNIFLYNIFNFWTIGNMNESWEKKDVILNHNNHLNASNYSQRLTIIIQDYEEFRSELWNIKNCNSSLFLDFIMWPIATEWRPAASFKEHDFEWDLYDRLNSFNEKLISGYPKYTNIINCYCRLYLELWKNPCCINSSKDIGDMLVPSN